MELLNLPLLKEPWNWLIVGFVLFVLMMVFHILCGQNIQKDAK